ncbi:MAG: Hpt domain-containing protein [Pseudanabaenaceae cyanobacterium]
MSDDIEKITTDLVDLNYIQEISGNDAEIERELFQIYFEDTYQRLETIQNCITNHDLPGIAAELHHLKGSSGNVGSRQIAKLVVDLEGSYRTMEQLQILAEVQKIYSSLDEVKSILVAHYGGELFN